MLKIQNKLKNNKDKNLKSVKDFLKAVIYKKLLKKGYLNLELILKSQ